MSDNQRTRSIKTLFDPVCVSFLKIFFLAALCFTNSPHFVDPVLSLSSSQHLRLCLFNFEMQ